MNLAELKGMKWSDVVETMDKKFLLVATSPDLVLRDAAVLSKNQGAKVGAAYVAASMLAQENPIMALSEGVRLYKELAAKHDIRELRYHVDEMENWTAWAGIPFSQHTRRKVKWPIRIPKKILFQHCRYLNFLLLEGLRHLDSSNIQTNTIHLAIMGVRDFLTWIVHLDGGLRLLKKQNKAKQNKAKEFS